MGRGYDDRTDDKMEINSWEIDPVWRATSGGRASVLTTVGQDLIASCSSDNRLSRGFHRGSEAGKGEGLR